MRDRVRRLQRRDDALRAAQQLEGRERLLVGARDVLRAAGVFQVAVLRSDPRIVEPGADGVGFQYLAALVLEQVAARSVQHAQACPPPASRRGAPSSPWPAASTPISRTVSSSTKG